MPPERAPYGRQTEFQTQFPRVWPPAAPGSPLPTEGPARHHVALAPYRGETYYGLSAIKRSHYRWLIISYFFAGGIAGAASVLSAVANRTEPRRHRGIVRAGRYLALLGAVLSPAFLIADLHTPRRWYNMLRIFRPTSPMSIGAWALAGFGTLSGLTAVGQLWEDATGSRLGRGLARICELPAALFGMLMSVYTGTLLAATSTPLWASVPRLLPALFGASAASTATAAISLTMKATGGSKEEHHRLEKFSLISATAELALLEATRKSWREQGLDEPVQREPYASALRFGSLGAGVLLPLAVHAGQVLTGRRSRRASTVASVSTLLGGYALRTVLLLAGNHSAKRPQDYFKFTEPRETGEQYETRENIEPPISTPEGSTP